jgi:hypothetical protein
MTIKLLKVPIDASGQLFGYCIIERPPVLGILRRYVEVPEISCF